MLQSGLFLYKMGTSLCTIGAICIILGTTGVFYNEVYASQIIPATPEIESIPEVPESYPITSTDSDDTSTTQLTAAVSKDTVKPPKPMSDKKNTPIESTSAAPVVSAPISKPEKVPQSVQINEQFAGSSLNTSLWEIISYPKGYRNNEEQTYIPSQVKVSDGTLQLTASRDSEGEWYSGEVHSKWNYKYGEFEVKVKMSAAAQGVFPAAWLLSVDDHWPNGGEIDIYESINSDPRIYGTAHGGGSNGHWLVQRSYASVNVTEYHTYKVIKSPGLISFWVDGIKYGEVRQSDMPAGGVWPYETNRFRGQLNLAIGGNWPGPSTDETPDTVVMYVDSFTVKNAY